MPPLTSPSGKEESEGCLITARWVWESRLPMWYLLTLQGKCVYYHPTGMKDAAPCSTSSDTTLVKGESRLQFFWWGVAKVNWLFSKGSVLLGDPYPRTCVEDSMPFFGLFFFFLCTCLGSRFVSCFFSSYSVIYEAKRKPREFITLLFLRSWDP